VYGEKRVYAGKGGKRNPSGQTDLDVWKVKTGQAIQDLRGALTEFEKRLTAS
jgi:hypothetical protein